LTPEDAPLVVLWATDRTAYGRLSRLITTGIRRAAKGECQTTLDDVAAHAEGLLAGVVTAERKAESEVGKWESGKVGKWESGGVAEWRSGGVAEWQRGRGKG
jgi:error-prone DNA polymerase